MKITKKGKQRIIKGAVLGGVAGAVIGIPIIGAAAGGYLNYNKKKINKLL